MSCPFSHTPGPLVVLAALLLFGQQSFAAAGDIRFQDDFESGFAWATACGGGTAGINTYTLQSPTTLMFLAASRVCAISPVIDVSDLFGGTGGAVLTAWLRRGVLGAPFGQSDMPEFADSLSVYYFSTGSWVLIQTFDGEFGFPWDTGGDVFQFSFALPQNRLHANLRLGFLLNQGGGANQDFWHVDDVVLTETQVSPPLAPGVCDEFDGSSATNWTFAGTGTGGVSGVTSGDVPVGEHDDGNRRHV